MKESGPGLPESVWTAVVFTPGPQVWCPVIKTPLSRRWRRWPDRPPETHGSPRPVDFPCFSCRLRVGERE